MLFDEVTLDHIYKAIPLFEEKGLPEGLKDSAYYYIIVNGKTYPPKPIMAYANELATGKAPGNYFLGGHDEPSFKRFEQLGIPIIKKEAKHLLAPWIDRYKVLLRNPQEFEYNEWYKWETIEFFRRNWPQTLNSENINAALSNSFLDEGANLWSGLHYLPIKLLQEFAQKNPSAVADMLNGLFNEGINLDAKLSRYLATADSLLKAQRPNEDIKHYQSDRSISVLLALKQPEKHFLYKHQMYKDFCDLTGISKFPNSKKGLPFKRIQSYYEMAKYVKSILLEDAELMQLNSNRQESGISFNDENLLTQDFIYAVSKYLKSSSSSEIRVWIVSPGDNASKWEEFQKSGYVGLGWSKLGDLSQYNTRDAINSALNIHYPKEGQEDRRNDLSANDDFIHKMGVGDYIIAKKGRKELVGYGVVASDYYFDPSAEYGSQRKVDWKHQGNWKVDHHLVSKTLTDISHYPIDEPLFSNYYEKLFDTMGVNLHGVHHREKYHQWLIHKYGASQGTPNSYVKAIRLLSETLRKNIFHTKDEKFLQELYSDLVKNQRDKKSKYYLKEAPSYGANGFYSASIKAYLEFLDSDFESKEPITMAQNLILYGPPGTGKTYTLNKNHFPNYTVQESSLTEEEHFIELVQDLAWHEAIALALLEVGRSKVQSIMDNRWLKTKASLSASKNVRATVWGSLQNHTIRECEHVNYKSRTEPLYFNKDINSYWEVLEGVIEEQSPELIDLKKRADEFSKNPDQIIKRYVFTTFHQAFSYEDFIEGIKPRMEASQTEDLGYEIADGVFKKICKRASNDPQNRYAIFIDEINRGNIANIFGELITLIEADKRTGMENEMSVTLPYSKEPFSVPANLDIIGTMNTADRSVEALDTALRRRFNFQEMMPEPSLIDKVLGDQSKFDGLQLSNILETINNRIEKLVDRDHTIGHAYFLKLKGSKDLRTDLVSVFCDNIIPLLQEYFYNDYPKIGLVLGAGFIEQKTDEVSFAEFKSAEYVDEFSSRGVYRIRSKRELLEEGKLEEALKLLLGKND